MTSQIRLLVLLPVFFLTSCDQAVPVAQKVENAGTVKSSNSGEQKLPGQDAPTPPAAPESPKEKKIPAAAVANPADSQPKHDVNVPPPQDSTKEHHQTTEVAVENRLPDAEPSWTRMDPKHPIWIDVDKKQVIVAGQICLRMGQLEMFACPKHSKEHESVVVIGLRPELVHAGLLSLDINPGKPVQYDPEFKPASGPEIEIRVRWMSENGVKEVRSQEMVRSFRDKKEMTSPWVFGGSIFYEDPDSKTQTYAANQGSFVCLSNFPDAMFDVPVQSSDSSDALLFEANPDKIPALGTQVYLIFEAAKKPASDAK